MKLDEFERVGFCQFPTPLIEMFGLEKELRTDKRLFFKRDDTTIVGLGGNKNRKLEFVMAEARRREPIPSSPGRACSQTTAGRRSHTR